MRHVALVGVAALAFGCGRGDGAPASAPATRAQAAAGGPRGGDYAVVSHAAPYFIAARADATSFRAQTEPRVPEPEADAAAGIVLRVISARDGWVEVENPSTVELATHCRGALDELDPFKLRFFVREDALAWVVTRRYTETYPDGTRIDLMPGLPLGPPDGAGRLPGLRRAVKLLLAMPAGAAGRSYTAPTPDLAKSFEVDEEAPWPDDAKGVIGEARLTIGPHELVMRQSDMLVARPTKGGWLVDYRDDCARVTARAQQDEVGMFGVGGDAVEAIDGFGGGGVTDHDTRYLYPGVALFWHDGTPAGEAREQRSYDLWRSHPTRKELACIDHDLAEPWDTLAPQRTEEGEAAGPRPVTFVTLCFRYEDTNYRWE